MENRIKVLIDTDIGDDIDDAFALLSAMALNFEIVGVTTVFRDTDARARMVKKLLKSFGRGYENVPVYAGHSFYGADPEVNTEHMCRFTEDLYRDDFTPDSTNPDDAVDFIIDSCKRYGKELSVIAIGPFCNIAKAIEKDPQALDCAARVAIMGGAYFKQYADWNVMCDVPAADLMFRSLRNLACIGADVTHKLQARPFLMEALASEDASNEALRYVSRLYWAWQADYPTNHIVLHDVLVMYYVLDPSVCTMQDICVKVITEGYAKGFTLNIGAYSKASLNRAYEGYDLSRKIPAAADVDLEKFHDFVRRDISVCKDADPTWETHLNH